MRRHQTIIHHQFQTRPWPCSIAVRAAIKKWMHSTKNQPHFGAICTSLSRGWRRILPFGYALRRFSENRTLKTEDPQPRCGLLFPNAASRCTTTGLLEQMP
jgi:hypothetical protein